MKLADASGTSPDMQGSLAFIQGGDRADCPYPQDDPRHALWQAGYTFQEIAGDGHGNQ